MSEAALGGEKPMDERNRPNFGAMLGMRLVERAEGHAVFELDLREEHCNLLGSVHGGVVMAMLDACGLWAGPSPEGAGASTAPRAATAALNCNFLRAARLADTTLLRATAHVTRRGRSMYFSSIELHGHPDGQLLATAQGVYGLAAVSAKPAA